MKRCVRRHWSYANSNNVAKRNANYENEKRQRYDSNESDLKNHVKSGNVYDACHDYKMMMRVQTMSMIEKEKRLIYVLRRLVPNEYSTESVFQVPTDSFVRVLQPYLGARHCPVRVGVLLSRIPSQTT